MDSETPLSASDPAPALSAPALSAPALRPQALPTTTFEPTEVEASAENQPIEPVHIDPPTADRPYPVADSPTFLSGGVGQSVPVNTLIMLKPATPAYINPLEAEAVANVGKRELSREELDRVQGYVKRWLHSADREIAEKYRTIREQAHENSEKLKDLLKRERGLEKQERKLKEKDKTLAERQKILEDVEKIMNEMPENMDEEGTRQYLNKRRKWMIATWESLIKHSTNESTRLKALTRLSDEDRGQHGKDLRDDETAGPKIMLMEKGTYGIPA